jgi:hypothetical protein
LIFSLIVVLSAGPDCVFVLVVVLVLVSWPAVDCDYEDDDEEDSSLGRSADL